MAGVHGEIHVLLRMPVALPTGGVSLNHACLLTWLPSAELPDPPSAGRPSAVAGSPGPQRSQALRELLAVVPPRRGALPATRGHSPKPHPPLSRDVHEPLVSAKKGLGSGGGGKGVGGGGLGVLQFSGIIEMPGVTRSPRPA